MCVLEIVRESVPVRKLEYKLVKICKALECDIGDIMEIVDEADN